MTKDDETDLRTLARDAGAMAIGQQYLFSVEDIARLVGIVERECVLATLPPLPPLPSK